MPYWFLNKQTGEARIFGSHSPILEATELIPPLGGVFKTLKMEQNNFENHWKAFALFFKNVMEAKGMTVYALAKKTEMQESTIHRFFNLDFCLRFDRVLKIVHALELNLFFESRDSDSDLNQSFEKAMEELGRRAGKLPKN